MKAFKKSDIKKTTAVLAAFVALCTAYVLTMPAISVTQDAARPAAGFYTQGQQADAAATGAAAQVDGAAQADAVQVDVQADADGTGSADAAAPADAKADAIPTAPTASSTSGNTGTSSTSSTSTTPDTPGTDAPSTPAYPKQDLRQKADLGDGLTLEVRVEAGEGTLPEGTVIRLDAIPKQETIDLMKAEAADRAEMPADATGVIATDISFVGPDGSAVEPRGKVVVSLTCPVIGPDTRAAMAHVRYAEHPEDPDGPDGRDKADIVELRDLDGRDTVERSVEQHTIYFEATDFSPYGIVYLPPAAVDAVPDPDAPDAGAATVAPPAGTDAAPGGTQPDGAPAPDGTQPADTPAPAEPSQPAPAAPMPSRRFTAQVPTPDAAAVPTRGKAAASGIRDSISGRCARHRSSAREIGSSCPSCHGHSANAVSTGSPSAMISWAMGSWMRQWPMCARRHGRAARRWSSGPPMTSCSSTRAAWRHGRS